MITSRKSLGQHWLQDETSLQAMCDIASVGCDDFVLEIGPGLGTLTQKLAEQAKEVVAVEYDGELAKELPARIKARNVIVVRRDILRFDLTALPAGV